MMRQLIFALVTLAATLAGAAAQEGYRIRPGDVLRLEVIEDPNLNRSALVLPDGSVTFPLAGSVQAGGRTLGEVQATLTDRLAPNFASRPTVFVGVDSVAAPPVRQGGVAAAPATIEVYILGEAAKPGKYLVTPGTTLLQFIAESGGFSSFAAKKRIQLRRDDASGKERIYRLNYAAIEAGTSPNGGVTLQDGDVIVVPQRRLFE